MILCTVINNRRTVLEGINFIPVKNISLDDKPGIGLSYSLLERICGSSGNLVSVDFRRIDHRF